MKAQARNFLRKRFCIVDSKIYIGCYRKWVVSVEMSLFKNVDNSKQNDKTDFCLKKFLFVNFSRSCLYSLISYQNHRDFIKKGFVKTWVDLRPNFKLITSSLDATWKFQLVNMKRLKINKEKKMENSILKKSSAYRNKACYLFFDINQLDSINRSFENIWFFVYSRISKFSCSFIIQ